MSLEDLKEALKKVLDPSAIRPRDYEKSGYNLEIRSRQDQLEAVAKAARDAKLFLESITAVDFVDGLKVVYHFKSYDGASRVVVWVQLMGGESLPTISSLYDAALWHEREVYDLFGTRFDGHPDLRRILLPEDADFHPLRKDFGKVHSFRKREEIYDDPNA